MYLQVCLYICISMHVYTHYIYITCIHMYYIYTPSRQGVYAYTYTYLYGVMFSKCEVKKNGITSSSSLLFLCHPNLNILLIFKFFICFQIYYYYYYYFMTFIFTC